MKSHRSSHAFCSLRSIGTLVFAFTVLASTWTGCVEIEDTVAIIYVQNSLGAPVQGAEVRLHAVGSVDQDFIGEVRFDTTQISNAAGSVSFDFSDFYEQGQAGFAVLDIEATKGALSGIGIIKVEEETTNEQTVVLD